VRRVAAVAALLAAAVPVACGEKDERVTGPPRSAVRELVASGLAAVGSTPSPLAFRSAAVGSGLRVRSTSRPPGGGLLSVLPLFERLNARVVPFCPKPALLRCRPALQAWGVLRAGQTPSVVRAALLRLAARTYGQRPLIRSGRRATRIVTANGELLGAVRVDRRTLSLSFGGPRPPGTAANAPRGRLVVEAEAAAVAAIRSSVSPRARDALAGVSRIRFEMPLAHG
jgi:hypothetical protein